MREVIKKLYENNRYKDELSITKV